MFGSYTVLPAVVEAALERRLGNIVVDGPAARITLGCYALFAGDAQSDGARRLISSVPKPCELIYDNDPSWRARILDVLGPRVCRRDMEEFSASLLELPVLEKIEALRTRDFELVPMNSDLASRLDAALEPHALQTYPDAVSFVEDGYGFAVLTKDGILASAATSYARSSRYVEVAVATLPEFRGHGLAAVAAARLVRECLLKHHGPCWSASNPVSKRLAVRLGFRPQRVCEVLLLAH